MSFFNSTFVKKTQKRRRCDWCLEHIEIGEPSVYTAGTFEGDFFTGRYHPECREATRRWYERNRCWGEAMPDDPMNRGGIRERGEKEDAEVAT
jgi:hypothetical protein